MVNRAAVTEAFECIDKELYLIKCSLFKNIFIYVISGRIYLIIIVYVTCQCIILIISKAVVIIYYI